ncbi:MAG: hypothetical protein ACR2PB_04265, partial [Desulfocapsaceae bacterium]
LGGLSEKAYILNKIWENTGGPVINVDAGNPLFHTSGQYGSSSIEYINARAVADIYNLLGFDAVGVGPKDLSGGLDLLQETAEQGIPWTSANLYDRQGRRVFEPFRSKRIDNLLIAIVGITDPVGVESEDFVIEEPIPVLAELLPELEESFDLILLLATMQISNIVELVSQYPQIHIVIAGDNAKNNVAPFLTGTTIVTQTGNRGRYQGVLSVDWNGQPLGENTASILIDLRMRLKSISLQLQRLETNPWDAASQNDKIAQLKDSHSEISKQIERLEKQQESGTAINEVSTFESRFLPLSHSGRADPQIDYIIRDAKKQIEMNRKN